jgi:gliding motility-associated-like protein
MKNLLHAAFVILLLSLITIPIKATHIIGGDLTYVCQGADPLIPANNIYLFTMKVYRDCYSGQAPFDSAPGAQTGFMTVYNSGNMNSPFLTIELDAPAIDTIDPTENNPCVVIPPNVCVQRGEYIFTLSLPVDQINSYFIVYQRCCRNNTINNILNPNASGATYFIELIALAQTECNSSPVFNNLPPPVVCAGFQFNFDHSASDADGDQLIYSFCAPLLGGAQNNPNPDPDLPPPYTPVSYVLPNYSETNPMGGNPQITIDPLTGIISGTPNVQGQFVVGICVQEYRNGILMSEIQRDFQFNVSYCEETVSAAIAGIDSQAGQAFAIYSCNEAIVEIINESTDEDFIEEYYWQFDFDPASGLPLSFDTRDVTVEFPGAGFYQGLMVLNPGTQCSDTAYIEVTILPEMFPDFIGVYDTCVAGPVLFENNTNANGAPLEFYEWEFGDLNSSDEENPEYEYDVPGVFDVQLTATDSLGCSYSITKQLVWQPAPKAIIFQPSTSVGCPPLEVTFQNLSYPIDSTYLIEWTFGDDSVSTDISPSHTYLIPGRFDIHIQVTSPIGCFEEAYFPRWIDVDSLPIADFYYEPPSFISNFNPSVAFHDNSRRAAFWAWEFGVDGEFGSTLGEHPIFTFPDTGFVDVQLAVMHYYGCVDTIVKPVEVIPRITYTLPNAFTPNNDGLNDEFRGGGYFRGITNFEMVIWDRYGAIIFQTNDPTEGWNGQANNTGRRAPNGSYVCIVRYTDPRGGRHEEKGFANLFR